MKMISPLALSIYIMTFGCIHVFGITGSWQQIGNDIDGEAPRDWSSHSISLNEHGTILAIGSPGNDDGRETNKGHIRVYEYEGNDWQQIGNDIDGSVDFEYLGDSVSLSHDGTILAAGSFKGVRGYQYNGTEWQ